VLRSFILAARNQACRNVRDPYRRIRCVDVLPTLSARPVGIDAKVFRFDDDLDALVDFRRHVDAGKRCMSTLRLVKWGDPHQTMHSDFTREETESILASHSKRCGLQACFLARLIIVENRLEALL